MPALAGKHENNKLVDQVQLTVKGDTPLGVNFAIGHDLMPGAPELIFAGAPQIVTPMNTVAVRSNRNGGEMHLHVRGALTRSLTADAATRRINGITSQSIHFGVRYQW